MVKYIVSKAISDEEKIHDTRSYPEYLVPLVKVLFQYEEQLTDGFHYYCTPETFSTFVQALYDAVKEG